MTAEQLETARAERMRQNGHGAFVLEDVRTWIEETGLCIFLPRSAQAGQSLMSGPTATPTFVEAVAGQRTPEPTPELLATAETLLVRLEAEGVAVRLNLAGQPLNHSGDQPDYVVAGWVLPYIYALRGDRDWRRSPQLTGSRQVSQLAVQAAKQIDTGNQTAMQIRDALGREVTETAVLRALHELWKQLRIIPVVPEAGVAALWQPLRQRFQKAIAEGASTSQVTAISVLASIYLQAVIAASMEDIEAFLSPLTSRSKIREVVRGLAATRQVHTTTMGQSPMFYVAGTLPEFPVAPSFQISPAQPAFRSPNYRGSTYLASYLGQAQEEDWHDAAPVESIAAASEARDESSHAVPVAAGYANGERQTPGARKSNAAPRPKTSGANGHSAKLQPSGKAQPAGKSGPPRPRASRSASASHPRERSRAALGGGDARPNGNGDRRRPPASRSVSGGGNSSRTAAGSPRPARGASFGNGGPSARQAHAAGNGHAHHGNGADARGGASRPSGQEPGNGSGAGSANGNGARSDLRNGTSAARPAAGQRSASDNGSRKPEGSAAKRYSFSGQQAKQAPKATPNLVSSRTARPAPKGSPAMAKPRAKSPRLAESKRRG